VDLFKKIVFYLFLSISLAVAIWGYFKLKESKEPHSTVLEHISANTTCLIETNNYSDLINQLIRQNLIWNSLSEDSLIKVAENNLSYFDSLIKANKELKSILDHNKLYFSSYLQSTKTSYLIQFKLKEANSETYLTSYFKTQLTEDKSTPKLLCYYKIIHGQKWMMCLKDGIVYVSDDLKTIETQVNLKKEESLAFHKPYLNLLTSNGKQKTSVFLNTTSTKLFNSDLLNKPSIYATDFQLNQLSLSGYTEIDTTTIFHSLANQKPQTIDFYSELPDHPVSFSAISISNSVLFHSKLKVNSHKEIWTELNDSALYDIKTEFLNTLENGMISANYQVNQTIQYLSLLKTTDSEKNKTLFHMMSDSVFVTGDVSIFKLKEDYTNLFSWIQKDNAHTFVGVSKNTIAFCSNEEMLNSYLNAINTNNTLSKNTVFMNYASNNLLVDCNYMNYEQSEHLKNNKLKSLVNTDKLNLKEHPYTHVSFIASHAKSLMQIRLNLIKENNKPNTLNTTNYLWSFKADSSNIKQLYQFTNHTTQEHEIAFQDNNHALFLINSTGSLIWKKKLSEPILSAIYTVDMFKNGKLQLLFNTKNHIHIIDRTGKDVEGFPIKAPQDITSPITLLDYDNNKDYRIFIACADKKIYNYSLNGLKTVGYIPFQTNHRVELPIFYVKVGLSDYLMTVDVNGNIYAFSRKGLGRIDFKNKTIKNLNHLYIQEGTNVENTKLIYVDNENNELHKISYSDKKETIKLGNEIQGFKTTFSYINDDTQKDLICFGSSAFYGYDLFSNKLIEYSNEQAVYDYVECLKTSTKSVFIGFNKTEQKTDIISSEGKLIKQYNNTTEQSLVLDLYKNDKQFLLLINHNSVNCVELN
jgi:hypothetical protein